MSAFQNKFDWPSEIIHPRDSREVITPIEDVDEKVVSDVIPTQCVTPSYPVLGTTTYGNVMPGNIMQVDGGAMEFSSYVIRRLEPDRRPGFTRFWASRTIAQSSTPVKTKTYQDDHLWYDIVHKIELIADRTFTRVTEGPGGQRVYAPRYFPKFYVTTAAGEGTLFERRTFVSSSVPTISKRVCPQPTEIRAYILGVRIEFERCLHPKLVFDKTINAFVAFNPGTGAPVAAASTIAGQVFPETNFDEWVRYCKEVTRPEFVANALWTWDEIWVNPPEPSEIIISAN